MAYNENIFEAIEELHRTEGKDKKQVKAAYDALLSAGTFQAFKNNFAKHITVWDSLIQWQGNPSIEEKKTLVTGNQFIEEEHDIASFTLLKKTVHRARVLMGLSDAPDDVLIAVLTNNSAECRAYLASKPQLFGTLSLGEKTQVDNKDVILSEEIMPDELVKGIQKEALTQLIVNKIKASNDPILWDNLLNAGDQNGVKNQLVGLGIPLEAIGTRGVYPLNQSVKNAIKLKKQQQAKSDCLELIRTGSADTLNDYEQLLQNNVTEIPLTDENIDNAYTVLAQSFENLSKEDVPEIMQELAKKFLLINIPNFKTWMVDNHVADDEIGRRLIALINAPTLDEFKTKLKAIAGDHKYIELGVTDKLMTEAKFYWLKSFLKNHANNVMPYTEVTTLADFKTLLKSSGITATAWMTDEQFEALQKAACTNEFVKKLKAGTHFSVEAHTALVSLFNSIPIEKQRSLLQGNNVELLLNATDEYAVEYFLGHEINPESIQPIVEENQRNNRLKFLHNYGIAKVLATIDPPITLSEDKIKQINYLIANAGDINEAIHYGQLINAIYAISDFGDATEFKRAFNLNEEGALIDDDSAITASIRTLHQHNKATLDHYNDPINEPYQKIFDVLLGVNKTVNLNADLRVMVKNALNASTSAEEFIDEVFPTLDGTDYRAMEREKLRKHLQKVLTPTVYDACRVGYLHRQLKEGSTEDVKEIIAGIDEQLKEFIKSRKQFVGTKSKLKQLKDIEPIHLFNPAFQGSALLERQQMIEKYTELAENCDLIVDSLQREKNFIQQSLSTLPEESENGSTRINSTKKKLESELKSVDADLEFYRAIRDKVRGENGILKAIDGVSKKDYVLMTKDDELIVTTIKQSEYGAYTALNDQNFQPDQGNTRVETNVGDSPLFNLVNKLEKDEVRIYDSQHGDLRSRFTEKRLPGQEKHVVKGDKIEKMKNELFVLERFPRYDANDPNQDPIQEKEAKLKCAMQMAAQIVASLDKPPTKDDPLVLRGKDGEELQYLLTALLIVGRDSNMKFGNSAIKVRCSKDVFDPQKELSTFGGINIGGFSKDSLYTREFKDNAIVKEVVEKLKEVTKMSHGHKKEQKSVHSSIDKVTTTFRGKLSDARNKLVDDMENKGPTQTPGVRNN